MKVISFFSKNKVVKLLNACLLFGFMLLQEPRHEHQSSSSRQMMSARNRQQLGGASTHAIAQSDSAGVAGVPARKRSQTAAPRGRTTVAWQDAVPVVRTEEQGARTAVEETAPNTVKIPSPTRVDSGRGGRNTSNEKMNNARRHEIDQNIGAISHESNTSGDEQHIAL